MSTTEITTSSEYKAGVKDFFSNFKPAWAECESQVLKLETRQTYIEKGNPSYELMAEGKLIEAIELIPSVRSSDLTLYKSLNDRKIDFIRCRPVVFPLSEYLQWEFECYKFNAAHCEQIFCLEEKELASIFDSLALHDFMVFDHTKAFIHDYDTNGEIQGGWIVKDSGQIENLITLYSLIRAHSIDFTKFINKHSAYFPSYEIS